MTIKHITIVALSIFTISCGQNSTNQEATVHTPEAHKSFYGELITNDHVDPYGDIKTTAYQVGSAEGKIQGSIVQTCAKKGCWMEVATGDDTLFVKFKDYGFFVPTEGVEGKIVTMRGVASLDTVSVEELQHFAEDAGKSAEEIAAITQEQYKVRFTADGLIIE